MWWWKVVAGIEARADWKNETHRRWLTVTSQLGQ